MNNFRGKFSSSTTVAATLEQPQRICKTYLDSNSLAFITTVSCAGPEVLITPKKITQHKTNNLQKCKKEKQHYILEIKTKFQKPEHNSKNPMTPTMFSWTHAILSFYYKTHFEMYNMTLSTTVSRSSSDQNQQTKYESWGICLLIAS